MGILTNWFSKPKQAQDERAFSDLLAALQSFGSFAGEDVTPENALRLSAVNACITVISEDIASTPFFVNKKGERGPERDRNHPVYKLLHDSPNEDMTAIVYKETMTKALLLYGNAYSRIVRKNGRPSELRPLDPRRVTIERSNGEIRYKVATGANTYEYFSAADMLHLVGRSKDGIRGIGVIEEAANAFGIALAVDRFSSKFWSDNINLSAYIKVAETLPPAKAKALLESFKANHAGASNAFGLTILDGNKELVVPSIPPEQAQFLQTKQYSVIDICRLFRISPTKIADYTKSNFNTLEQAYIDHVRSTLRPWAIKWEQECNRKLLLEVEKEEYYCEMELDALTRGDVASQDNSFGKGIQMGWYSINDVRRLKNLPEIDGGDVYLVPLNMAPAAKPEEAPEEKPAAKEDEPVEAPAADVVEPSTKEDKERFAPLIDAAARRMATKIGKALSRAKEKEGNLTAWLDAYLTEKRGSLKQELLPVAMITCAKSQAESVDNCVEKLRALLCKELEDAVAFNDVEGFSSKLRDYIIKTYKEHCE